MNCSGVAGIWQQSGKCWTGSVSLPFQADSQPNNHVIRRKMTSYCTSTHLNLLEMELNYRFERTNHWRALTSWCILELSYFVPLQSGGTWSLSARRRVRIFLCLAFLYKFMQVVQLTQSLVCLVKARTRSPHNCTGSRYLVHPCSEDPCDDLSWSLVREFSP